MPAMFQVERYSPSRHISGEQFHKVISCCLIARSVNCALASHVHKADGRRSRASLVAMDEDGAGIYPCIDEAHGRCHDWVRVLRQEFSIDLERKFSISTSIFFCSLYSIVLLLL